MSEIPVVPHVKKLICNKQKTAAGFNAHLKEHSYIRKTRTRGKSSQWFIWAKKDQMFLKTGSKHFRNII